MIVMKSTDPPLKDRQKPLAVEIVNDHRGDDQ